MNEPIYWKGKRLEDMEKEELVQAMKWLMRRYHEEMSPENIRYKAIGRAKEFMESAR